MKTIFPGFFQASDLTEIIFAHRNQQYGAYELRKNYNLRLAKAGGITFTTVLCSLFILSLAFKRGEEFSAVPETIDFTMPEIFTLEKTTDTKPPAPDPVQRPASSETIPQIVDSIPETAVDTASASVPQASSPGSQGVVSIPAEGGASSGPIVDLVDSSANKDQVIMHPEVYPSFPGGQKAFARFLQRNFSCDGNQIRGGEGKITLTFIVTKDGSLESMKVLRENTGIDCVEELLKVMRKSPKWNPGSQNNQPVNVQMILPVTVQQQ